jgi:hypothetical protein
MQSTVRLGPANMNPSRPSTIRPHNAYVRAKELLNLQTFAQNLKVAVNGCLPSHQKPFGQVAVLAMHWANNDLPGIVSMEIELLQVFRNVYNFNTESFLLPAVNDVQQRTSTRILQFLNKWKTDDGLAIVVYSGHATESDAPGQGGPWKA